MSIIIAVIFFPTGLVSVVMSCKKEVLDDCFLALHQSDDYRQMERNDTLFPTWNDTQVLTLCSAMATAQSCALNVTKFCSSAETKLYWGSDEVISYLCGVGFKDYRQIRDCLDKAAVRQSSSRCQSDYRVALRNLQGSKDEKILELCQTIDRLIECVRLNITVECGEKAATWTSTALKHFHLPAKEHINCQLIEMQVEKLSAPVIFGVLLLLLLLATTVVMVALLLYRRYRYQTASHRQPLHPGAAASPAAAAAAAKCSPGASAPVDSYGRVGYPDTERCAFDSASAAAAADAAAASDTAAEAAADSVPLMSSQSGISAAGRTVVSLDDDNAPSTAAAGVVMATAG